MNPTIYLIYLAVFMAVLAGISYHFNRKSK